MMKVAWTVTPKTWNRAVEVHTICTPKPSSSSTPSPTQSQGPCAAFSLIVNDWRPIAVRRCLLRLCSDLVHRTVLLPRLAVRYLPMRRLTFFWRLRLLIWSSGSARTATLLCVRLTLVLPRRRPLRLISGHVHREVLLPHPAIWCTKMSHRCLTHFRQDIDNSHMRHSVWLSFETQTSLQSGFLYMTFVMTLLYNDTTASLALHSSLFRCPWHLRAWGLRAASISAVLEVRW